MLTMTPEEKRARNAGYMREYYRRHPERVKAQNLKRLYGITVEEYEAIIEQQGGVCGCCKRAFNPDPKMRDRQVDHDHETGKLRGVVCAKCNYILGRVAKDVEILKLAVAYLERVN